MERAIANLAQALRELAIKLELPALWRWWLAELAPLIPAAPRTAVQRRRLRPVLAFGLQEAVLWDTRIDNGAVVLVEAAMLPLTGDPAAIAHAGRTAIAALPARARAGASSTKVVISLAPGQVLRKKITLPAAVEENLLEALTFDLDRHTPFRADQLYFDAVVIARDLAKKEIVVDWAAALKTIVDGARRHAESWGATVVGITPETLPAGAGTVAAPLSWSKLNLLPQEERSYRTPWRRWQFLAPAALVVVMALVAVSLPLWQKRELAIEMGRVTEQARAQAAASDALRQQLDQATGDYNFALGRKYAFPNSVQLLDDVTRLLPDDTWLTQFEVKSSSKGKELHREMLLRGESGNAGRLIAALEESKAFEQAAPRSPTTKIQPGPGEVFDLGTQVAALPPPPLVALVNPTPRTGTPEGPAHGGAPAATSPGSAPAAGATAGTASAPAGASGSPATATAGGAPAASSAGLPGSSEAPSAAKGAATSPAAGPARGGAAKGGTDASAGPNPPNATTATGAPGAAAAPAAPAASAAPASTTSAGPALPGSPAPPAIAPGLSAPENAPATPGIAPTTPGIRSPRPSAGAAGPENGIARGRRG